jgi:hypothetical protein
MMLGHFPTPTLPLMDITLSIVTRKPLADILISDWIREMEDVSICSRITV